MNNLLQTLRGLFENSFEENLFVAGTLLKLLSVPVRGIKLLAEQDEGGSKPFLLAVLLELQEEIGEKVLGIQGFDEILEKHKAGYWETKSRGVKKVVARSVEENLEQVKMGKICQVLKELGAMKKQ